ncbi:ATP-dependent DNA helicase Rep [Achromobacter deleyi]|uniref:DNA 3'-5' helicase n=1 Tax=Achromobacter deleyi TaxID=1353891 RepID=A0A6S6ZC40_9BURK|nr:ATP-dependent helicase [Achromobacter deleyi]CAB3670750.1 ATP-dependent DNA helicase Rep [Achromobacter deleyi]CAB3841376.1 ATP-dependent DNA helicase Rep [Achromobacter deleyi]CAB3846710.1 ATP-dependent DNA helicase Rep [Achromobacter deleyi]
MTPSSISVQFIPTGFVPTDEQRKIQASRHRINLVLANAGAAKTTTLALRIGEAISKGTAPEEILALTFTDEARQVLQARLTAVGIAYNTARRVRVQTVEEFARQVLAGMEDAVPSALASVREQKAFALDALENVGPNNPDRGDVLDIRTHNTAVSQFLDNLLKLKATLTLMRGGDGMDPEFAAEGLAVPLTDYLWAIEYEKQRIDLFGYVEARGFFDATYDLACALRTTPELHQALPAYKLVVCDELHDINEASFCIIETLLNVHQPYFVGVGDKDQVIYSHLGADDAFLQYRIAASFPDCATFPLSMTYRHGPHLAYAMEAFKNKAVESNLPLRTEIHEAPYADQPGACGQQVVEAVLQWKQDGKPLDACCILFRDQHQSIDIENALMQAQIQYRTLTMHSYLQRDEILFLRGMLAIALGDFHHVASPETRAAIVEALATFAEVPLTPQELSEAKVTIARDPATLEYFFEGQIKRVGNPAARARIEKAVEYLRSLEPAAPAHAALEAVCEFVEMEKLAQRLYVHPYEASVVTKCVNGFIGTARNLNQNLTDFSAWIGTAEKVAGPRPGKATVLLDCVANVKGKEFDHVIVPFLDQGEFPNPLRTLSEEENLFYVAATRAKARLTLIPAQDPARRSPFIARMQLAGTLNRANNAVRRNLAVPTATAGRRDLKVAYANKDAVKSLGAQWDRTRKVWYVPDHLDLEPFRNWLAEP